MKGSKRVAIKIYVPAGDICRGATFKCPLLLDMGNTPSSCCLLIPDSFWWNHERIIKHPRCPSLHMKGNILSDDDIKNERIRIVKRAVKNHTFDQYDWEQRDRGG